MLEMVNRIKEAEDYASLGAASDELIANAEATLQLTFAKDYKEYLSIFGVATFCGREMTGICTSERLSVIAVTQRAREHYENFPHDAYVIEEMLFDHCIVIQRSDGTIYNYGPNDRGEQIANSLSAYLFPGELKE